MSDIWNLENLNKAESTFNQLTIQEKLLCSCLANYNMEMLIRNALAFENVTESDVRDANRHEELILSHEYEKEGESQR